MDTSMFLLWERAIFRKVKKIKGLSGGVPQYAAQTRLQIGTEIAEKGRLQTEATGVHDSPFQSHA